MITSRVAAVIVTWNKIDEVCSVLEDITQLNLNNIQLDVFVVDNASTDGTQTYLEEYYPQVQVLQTGDNLGGSGGFSFGLQFVSQLEYDYIWLLDNDVRIDNQALLPLVDTLQNYAEVGLVGSQIRKLDEPQVIQEIGSFVNPKKAHLKTYFGNCPVTSTQKILAGKPYVHVDICAAASLLVRREVVQEIGIFENYFLHFDDVEWCLRAKQSLWVVAANPASIIWHSSPDFKQRPWVSYYDERNLFYCWYKHYPELLLKRIRVLLPKLIYYSVTGRFFLVEIYLQGLQDFLEGVQGKIPGVLPYVEYSLEEIINKSSTVLVQAPIYQDTLQNKSFQKLEFNQKIRIWNPPQSFVRRIWMWLIACFWKPIDITLITWQYPQLHYINLAKKVYFFTGTGYVKTNFRLTNSLQASIKVLFKMWQIYRQVSKL